jgi:predicted enzyme related to lactoylglutathione lyase
MPDGGEYWVTRLRGRDVAGIGTRPQGAPGGWNTYVEVAGADDAAAAAERAGGTVITPPVDAPPAGRLAVLADPAGATFAVWEPGDRKGAQLVNEPGAWAMSTLQTADPDAAAAFYGAVFGWTTEAFGPFTMFRLPGYVGGEPAQPVSREVIAVMAPGEGPPSWRPDFWVADVDAAAAAASDNGGRALVAPYDIGMSRMAVLADPGGATFSVSRASGT